MAFLKCLKSPVKKKWVPMTWSCSVSGLDIQQTLNGTSIVYDAYEDELHYCSGLSQNAKDLVFNRSTDTWDQATWSKPAGATLVWNGAYMWTYADDIYYSNISASINKVNNRQYKLNRSNNSWEVFTWGGYEYIGATWEDPLTHVKYSGANNVTISSGTFSISNAAIISNATASIKTWSYGKINGNNVWIDPVTNDMYCTSNGTTAKYDRNSDDWIAHAWSGSNNITSGSYVWNDGENIYYDYSGSHFILDRSNNEWVDYIWDGFTPVSGQDVWNDGSTTYYSSSNGEQYVLV